MWRLILTFFAVLAAETFTPGSAFARQAAQGCSAPPDAEAAVQSQKRFLVFGETHGTVEMPRVFAEIVCSIVAKRPVVVTVEYPEGNTRAFAAYLASNGLKSDRAKLFNDAHWSDGKQDGRKSRAMFAMIERLRVLRAGGAKIDIAAHLKMRPASAADHEAGMAKGLIAIAQYYPDAQILSLVGSAHAIRVAGAGGSGSAPMAAQLPSGQVFTVRFIGQAGTAWVCKASGEQRMLCGEHDVPGHSRAPSPEILLTQQGYDLQIDVGSTTASPPAALSPN